MRHSHPPQLTDRSPTAGPSRVAWGPRALLVLGTLGALAAGAVTVLVAGPGALRSTPAELAAAESTAAVSTAAHSPAERAVEGAVAGTCLTWTDPDAADITEVACSEPHLFEVAAVIAVGARVTATADPSTVDPAPWTPAPPDSLAPAHWRRCAPRSAAPRSAPTSMDASTPTAASPRA